MTITIRDKAIPLPGNNILPHEEKIHFCGVEQILSRQNCEDSLTSAALPFFTRAATASAATPNTAPEPNIS